MPEICFHPQMFVMNFGIELKMFFFFFTHPRNMFPTPKFLAQISGENYKCWVLYTFHPTNVWHESWDRIENFGFYTHPINMFDDQSPICLKSICSGVQSIEHPNVLCGQKVSFTRVCKLIIFFFFKYTIDWTPKHIYCMGTIYNICIIYTDDFQIN